MPTGRGDTADDRTRLETIAAVLRRPERDLARFVEALRREGWRVLFLPWETAGTKWDCVWWAREAPVDVAGTLIANDVLTPAERLALLMVWRVERGAAVWV